MRKGRGKEGQGVRKRRRRRRRFRGSTESGNVCVEWYRNSEFFFGRVF